MANAAGIRTRPIAAAIDYVTGPASHFLHCQLQKEVWKHNNVLKDSLDLIREFETASFSAVGEIRLTTADVVALYPSIRLDRGMAALQWFMDNHTSFNQTLKDLCLRLANFVLTNNYVECEELECGIYRQHIGTAMGTSFSVVYAVIFMIRLESPILEDPRFRRFIKLYKRFIDDIFLIWTGSAAALCAFRHALASADETIKLDWGGYERQSDALDPAVVAAKREDRAEFLDLDICVERSQAATRTDSWQLKFRPFRKPGNAHAYLPFTSFHARHTFRGWILAELLRLLTHSSTVEIWQEEGEFFYHCLCSRGYPRVFLRAVFREVTWGRRARMLEPKRKERGTQFFETYRACVLTLRNAPEWPALRGQLDLSLRELVESTYGDIFPPRAFLAQRNAPRLGSILKR